MRVKPRRRSAAAREAVARTNPTSPAVRAAERLVFAERAPRAAHVGAADSSIGDLLRVVVGADEHEALESLAMELHALSLAMEAVVDESPPLQREAERLVDLLARRAAAAAELHRRLRAAR